MKQKDQIDGLLDEALLAQKNGDTEAAEASLRKLLGKKPRQPDASFLLGMLCLNSGRAREAVDLLRNAVESVERQGADVEPAWRVALAKGRGESGDLVGALSELSGLAEDVGARSDVSQLHSQLLEKLGRNAQTLQKVGQHKEAVADLTEYLKYRPDDPRGYMALGKSLLALGRANMAADAFVKASELDQNYAPAVLRAAQALLRSGRTVDALPFLRQAYRFAPKSPKILLAFARALTTLGATSEARPLVEDYVARHPDDLKGFLLLGQIELTDGRKAEAAKAARQALALAESSPHALSLLSEAEDGGSTTALELIEKAIENATQDPVVLADLHFAAARQCEAFERYKEAFQHYLAANAARKQQLRQQGIFYDRKAIETEGDRQIAAFQSSFEGQPVISDSELPVFIVGMARSGTTLTEQILASHPDVAAGGELTEIGRIASVLAREDGYPERMSPVALREGADRYLALLREIGGDAIRVTDKMPGNLRHLGLIVRLFPKAKIIHCRRDPIDTGLSCFAQNFSFRGDAWTCDLADIGHAYCQYRRLMSHWLDIMPSGTILEIDYENLVADIETQARRIIEFVNLEWNDACLRFHENTRAVATPSRAQVRKPIYASSVGRWRRYGPGVEPLVRTLAACECAPDGQFDIE